MKVIKIKRNADKCSTFDITTKSGAFALPNNCVSHNSSVVINSTNGINLVKELIIVKESKGGILTQVVPEYRKLKNYYQLLWDQTDCVDYLKTSAVLGAFIDQGISTDTFYNPAHFEGGKIPATLIAKNLMLAHHWGCKSLYYSLINKQAMSEAMKEKETTSVEFIHDAWADTDEDDFCESCVL